MSTIIYLIEISLLKKFWAIISILIGLVSIFTNNSFFYIFNLAVGVSLLSTEGSEINLENKTYRTVKSIFGINFGKWKPCPNFDYVSVFSTNEGIEVSSYGASIRNNKKQVILLNLFYEGNKHITFYKTNDKADAFKVAEHFKLALDIDILDATKRESNWV